MRLEKTRRQKRTKPLVLLAALGTSLLFGGAGCQDAVPASRVVVPQRPEKVVAVRTQRVQQRPVRETLDYVGTVRAHHELKVSARTGGTLIGQEAQEGDVLKEGAVIARLDAPEPKARLRGVEAELRRARSQQAQACKVSKRDAALLKKKAVPQARADASRASCKAAAHGVSAIRARVDELNITLGHSDILTPSGGRALRWLVEPGESVRPGQPVLLVGSGVTELEVRVTDRDLARGILPGSVALVRADRGGYSRTEVRRVAAMASGPGRHVDVRVALPDALHGLPAGSALDVRFVLREDRVATPVPRRALVRRGASESVLFTIADGVVHPVRVTIGISEGELVAVLPALTPGTTVAVSNLGMLSAGARVFEVLEGASEPAAATARVNP